MNKFLKYIALGVAALGITSCAEEFLSIDPEDQIVADNFYKNETQVRTSTALLYGGRGWFDYVAGLQFYVGDMAPGDMYYTYDQEGQFFFYSFNSGNAHLTSGWKSLFRLNSYCNSVINDMPPAASKNGVSESVISAALGEAHFIRAWVYFTLAEYWGEVPIVENGSDLISSGNLMLNKNTRANIYELVRRDLEFAAENLPGKDRDAGRATKWAAKGLLAKLYLTMASDLASAGSAEYFNLAKQHAREVIENTDGWALHNNYAELFTIEGNNNKESLFALQMIGAGGYAQGNPRNTAWSRSSVIADQTWGAGKGPTVDFQKAIEPNDARRKSIVMQGGDFYPELNKAAGGYTYNIRTKDPSNPGTPLEDRNEMLSHIKKYVIGKSADVDGKVGTDQDAGNNIYMMRLAEMYLIYCEAAIGSGSSTSDGIAVDYLNVIRNRAKLAPKVAPITLDDLMLERRIEFGMESIRWFDIKRLYYRDADATAAMLTAQKRESVFIVKDGVSDENLLNSYEGYVLSVPANPITIYTEQIKAFPIPSEAVVANPKLNEPAVEYNFN